MRNEKWKKIWDGRAVKMKNDFPLHHVDGFDMISCDQWNKIVYYFCDKLKINGKENILEIGCGAGAFLESIKKRYTGVDIWGFDISDDLVNIAKNRVEGTFFINNAVSSVWGIEQKFDIIFGFSVFHYFNDLTLAKYVLNNSLKLLSPSGSIMIGDIPNKQYKYEDIEYRIKYQKEKSKLIDHLYYLKDFFINFAKKNCMKVEILDHKDCFEDFFPNISYRYSVFLKRI